MKFKVGEYWRTRDGRKARILATDCFKTNRSPHFPVVYLCNSQENGDDPIQVVSANGVSNLDDIHDLIEPWTDPPEEIEVFEWMWRNESGEWRLSTALSGDTTNPRDPNYRKTGRSWKVPK